MRDPEETRGIGKKDISKHIVTQKRNINHFIHLLLRVDYICMTNTDRKKV